jgi:hypothetical protein
MLNRSAALKKSGARLILVQLPRVPNLQRRTLLRPCQSQRHAASIASNTPYTTSSIDHTEYDKQPIRKLIMSTYFNTQATLGPSPWLAAGAAQAQDNGSGGMCCAALSFEAYTTSTLLHKCLYYGPESLAQGLQALDTMRLCASSSTIWALLLCLFLMTVSSSVLPLTTISLTGLYQCGNTLSKTPALR